MITSVAKQKEKTSGSDFASRLCTKSRPSRKKESGPSLPNREAVELNSRGQRPRKTYRKSMLTLKRSKNKGLKFDPSGGRIINDSDPVALPPAIKFVRCANALTPVMQSLAGWTIVILSHVVYFSRT
jgi:hypothetical protein